MGRAVWVVGATLGGVFYHVGSCFDTREGSGSGAVGMDRGRGRFVDCDSFVKAREWEREDVSLSVNRVAFRSMACHSVSCQLGIRCETAGLALR